MVTWQRTTLSTDPAMIEMADTDRRGLAIAAGETVTAVTAHIVNVTAPTVPLTGIIESVAINGANNGAVVIVKLLTRAVTYELNTIFTASDGEVWTKTTIIRCLA